MATTPLQATRRIMLIAGESSGDRIAARAIREARKLAASDSIALDVSGIGGDECEAEGMKCFHHAREMSVVGFVEVARRFRFFRNILIEMQRRLEDPKTRPELLVLVDYPGFNIRLAKTAKKLGIRVLYYVSPQVWAWHKERVHELKQLVDEMFVIFPFEEKIYRDAGLHESHFVGHPLVERIDEERKMFSTKEKFATLFGLDATKPWLLVFAGSRREEVRRLLPKMADAAMQFGATHGMSPILVESGTISSQEYSHALGGRAMSCFRDSGSAHELMYHAELGILKSGTTTLEAALLGLPGVICYITHPLTYAIGKRVVKLPYIGLANIVIGQKIYPELLQDEVTPENLVKELQDVFDTRESFRTELVGLSNALRSGEVTPSERVATRMVYGY